MNSTTDWRNLRSQTIGPKLYSVANYCTDSPKTDMKDAFGEEIFQRLHLIPEPLKKNLADTLVTSQTDSYKPPKQDPVMQSDYSPLSGIASFFSGMLSALSGAMFKRPRSPEGGVCVDDVAWQQAKREYKNGHDPSAGEANVAMSECKTAAAACEDKLNKVRQLLTTKPAANTRYRRRPRRVFVDPAYVEEHFEDAFCPDDFMSLANDTIIEYFSPLQYHEQEVVEVDAPKMRLEVAPIFQEHTNSVPVAEKNECVKNEVNEIESPEKVVSSCEDKLSQLKALLQNKCKNARTKEIMSDTQTEPESATKPTKSIPINKTRDKRFKNPHRLNTDKRQKSKLKLTIQEDMLFANEIDLDDASSVENSPSFHSLEKVSETPSYDTPQEFFDEISGRFRTASATSSEDSYQIVFNDIPKRVRSTSECDSEDSFIVFEESPDSCYTSNDVFGDSCSDCSDSESDVSDSGCDNMRLKQSLSRTVSNLTDDSLYDEVDSVRTLPDVCDSVETSTGLLLDERKKAMKKNLPAKKVRFSTSPPRVRTMRVWAFAARQARIGNWHQCSVDRERFQRRIADVDMAVSWVLKPQHRSRVMFQRFMPWWNAQKRRELAEKKQQEQNRRETEDQPADTTEVNTQVGAEVSENPEAQNSSSNEELESDNTQRNDVVDNGPIDLNEGDKSVNDGEVNMNTQTDLVHNGRLGDTAVENDKNSTNECKVILNTQVLDDNNLSNADKLKSDANVTLIYNELDVKACENPKTRKFENIESI